MTIAATMNFASDTVWAGGSGCIKCRSNVSELGAKAGIQCIDLGVEDEFLGRFGLCYDCAMQVARVIGYVSRDSTLEILEQARVLADDAVDLEQIAASEAEQAKADREAAETLLETVRGMVNKPSAPTVKKASTPATKVA